MDTVRTSETVIRRNTSVLRPRGRGRPHTEGAALMLTKEAQRALISWETVSSRFTNDAEEEKKDDFYNRLHKQTDKSLKVLMGDFNAKTGADNRGYEHVMDKQGLGRMNESWEFLAKFSAFNNMVIGSSIFPHKDIYKAIWRSPDHACMSQKTRSTMCAVGKRSGSRYRT